MRALVILSSVFQSVFRHASTLHLLAIARHNTMDLSSDRQLPLHGRSSVWISRRLIGAYEPLLRLLLLLGNVPTSGLKKHSSSPGFFIPSRPMILAKDNFTDRYRIFNRQRRLTLLQSQIDTSLPLLYPGFRVFDVRLDVSPRPSAAVVTAAISYQSHIMIRSLFQMGISGPYRGLRTLRAAKRADESFTLYF